LRLTPSVTYGDIPTDGVKMHKGTTPAFSMVEQGFFIQSSSSNLVGNIKVSELYGRSLDLATQGY